MSGTIARLYKTEILPCNQIDVTQFSKDCVKQSRKQLEISTLGEKRSHGLSVYSESVLETSAPLEVRFHYAQLMRECGWVGVCVCVCVCIWHNYPQRCVCV